MPLPYNVSLCEALCDVSPLVDLCGCDQVTNLVHAGSAVVQGLALIADKGKTVVLNLDRADSIPGEIRCCGSDCSNRFPFIAAQRVEDLHADILGVRPVNISLRTPAGNYRVYAFHFLRLARV